jgi:hypothetical protein
MCGLGYCHAFLLCTAGVDGLELFRCQRDATYIMFFIIISALHVSGGFSTYHQELIKLICSLGYCHAFLLSTAGVDGLELSAEQFQRIHTSGRQQESMTVPKAAYTVL